MPRHKKTNKRRHFIKKLFWFILGISFLLTILEIFNRQQSFKLTSDRKILSVNHNKQTKLTAQYHCKQLPSTHYWNQSTARIIETCTYTKSLHQIKLNSNSSKKPSNQNDSSKHFSALNPKIKLIRQIPAPENNVILTLNYNKQLLYLHIKQEMLNSTEMIAFMKGDFYQLASLLHKNDFDIFFNQNDDVYNMLDFAAKEGLNIIVDAIINSEYFNPSDNINVDAVVNAIIHNRWETLVLFIKKIPYLTDVDSSNNVLLICCYHGNLEILKKLNSHQYFNLNQISTRLSALALAIARERSDIIDYLYSAEIIEQYKNLVTGQNILHYILTDFIDPHTKELNITGTILIDFLINKNPLLLFDTDHAGKTPLNYAIEFGYTKIAALMNSAIRKHQSAINSQNIYYEWLKNKLTFDNILKITGVSLVIAFILFVINYGYKKRKANEFTIKNAMTQLTKLTVRLLSSSWEHDGNNRFKIKLTFYSAYELASIFNIHKSLYRAVNNELNIEHAYATQILIAYIKGYIKECAIINNNNHLILTFGQFEDLSQLQLSPYITYHPIFTRFYFQSTEFQTFLLNELNILTNDFSSTAWQCCDTNIYSIQPQLCNPDQLAIKLKGHSFRTITISNELFIELLSETINIALKQSVAINKFTNKLTFQLLFNNAANLTHLDKSFKNILAQKLVMHSDEHKQACHQNAQDKKLQQKTSELVQLHQELVDYLQRFNDYWIKEPLHRDFNKVINQFDRPGISNLNSNKMREYISKNIESLKNYKLIFDQFQNNAIIETGKMTQYLEHDYPNEDLTKLENIQSLFAKMSTYKENINYYRNNLASFNQAVAIVINHFDADSLKAMKKRVAKPDIHTYTKKASTTPLTKLSIITSNSYNNDKRIHDHNKDLIAAQASTTTVPHASNSIQSNPMNNNTILSSSKLLSLFPTIQTTLPLAHDQNDVQSSPNPTDSQVDNLFKAKYGTLDDTFLTYSDPTSCISIINYYISVINNHLNSVNNIYDNHQVIEKIKLFVKSLCLKAYLLYGLDEELFAQIPAHDILKRGFEKIYNPISNGLQDQFTIRDNEIIDFCMHLRKSCFESEQYQLKLQG